MTISTATTRITYTGNGSTTAFAVPFRFIADADLTVLLHNNSAGTDELQTLTTNYTVSGAGDAAGGITFVAASTPQVGQTVVIYNDPALTQAVDYRSGDAFPAETHEQALDLLTIQQQRTRAIADRTLSLLEGDTDGSGGYDANSNKIVNLAAPTLVGDATTKTYVDTLVNNTALGDPPTGLVATGSVTSRLLQDRWGERRNVKDFGVTGNGTTNDTVAFQAALDAGAAIFVPEGTYQVKDLVPNTNQDILCASPDTIFRGVSGSDDIFATSAVRINIKIQGGTYKTCAKVFSHSGSNRLENARFIGMRIEGATHGFDISAAVGCVWSECIFGRYATSGYGVLLTGTAASTANTISDCIFNTFTQYPISLVGTTVTAGTTIRGCYFRNGNPAAIHVGPNTHQISIENCSFVDCGSAGTPDVLIAGSGVGDSAEISEAHIERCFFGVEGSSQPYRVKVTGTASVTVSNCRAVLGTGTELARLEGTKGLNILRGNYIQVTGGGAGSYESKLYTVSGTPLVEWSMDAAGGVGLTLGANTPYRHSRSGEGFEILTLADEATPSVEGTRSVLTAAAGTITDFDDGRVGQLLTVLAAHAVTITHGTNIFLDGATDFDMVSTDSLTLVQKADGKWYEVSRSSLAPDGPAAVAAGAGITAGTGTVVKSSVVRHGDIFHTKFFIDVTGLKSFATGDIIGEDGSTDPAYFGRLTAADNGTVFYGRVTCVEVPDGGDEDIDFYQATESTGVPDAVAASTLTEDQLTNTGNWTLNEVFPLVPVPGADKYLYMVAGNSEVGVYSTGRFLIELWGYAA